MASTSVFVRRALAGARAISRVAPTAAVSRHTPLLASAQVKRVNVTAERSLFNLSVKEWAFKSSGYNQYGLYHDDILYETADVKEALRRLPPQVQDERIFRHQRAMHMSMKKIVLPKEEWPTMEEDMTKGRYLQPYLDEVVREREEREAWNASK